MFHVYVSLQEARMDRMVIGQVPAGDPGDFGQDMTLDACATAFPMWQCFHGRQNVMQLNLRSRCRIVETLAL